MQGAEADLSLMRHRVKRVFQNDEHGCGVACIAMITGVPYESVRGQTTVNLAENGLTNHEIQRLLLLYGYHACHVWRGEANLGKDIWPLKFMHGTVIANVTPNLKIEHERHWIVITKRGKVLDPERKHIGRFETLDSYGKVNMFLSIQPM